MKRTKLQDRILPEYTKGEEIFNMVSHIVGGTFGIAVTVLCIVFACIHKNYYGLASGIVYGLSMIILYTMSSIYHGLHRNKAKKVFQILDHCTIFLLIAGSYTPFCLCTFREYSPVLGWTLFGIIWAMAILGIVLNSIDLKKYKTFSMICYLVMGWCIIFKLPLLWNLIGATGTILLILGGVSYTIGAILYGVGKKHKYVHSIFHLFIVLASVLQFLTVILYVI